MNNADSLLNEAQNLLDSGQLATARERFMRICEIAPANAEAWLMLGTIDAETGDLDAAINHTRQAVRLDPNYEEAHLTLARLLQYQGQLEEALECCGRALAIDGGYEEAWLLQGAIQGVLGQHEASENSCRQAIRLRSDCVDAYVNLGNALKARGNADSSIESYQGALKIDSGIAEAWSGIGSAFLGKGDAEKALEHFNKALEIDPANKGSTLGAGCSLVMLDRLADAEPYAAKALEYYPENAEVHFMQGRILQDKGNADAALACYKKALSLGPAHVRSHFYLGTVFHSQNLLDEALTYYLEAVRLKPDYAQVYFRIGIIYQLQRQLDKAVLNYKEAAKHYREISKTTDVPRSVLVSTYCQLGYLYGSLFNDRDESIKYYKMALELEPDDEKARHYLASLGVGEVPERASDAYVAQLFDAMSDNFDDILVGTLEYRTPQRIFDAVRNILPNPPSKQDILDLGCGTGLCGPVFQELTGFIAGVDLSPKMVNKARERNLYDLLMTGELTDTMRNSDRMYTLVLSADVLIYFGNLSEVFSACFDVLVPGGMFAFSTETAIDEEQDFVLNKSGRYAHSRRYIEALAQQLDFSIVSYEQSVIRKEGGVPVAGMIYILRKPE